MTYKPLSDERVNELAVHWKHEYDREIEAILETRVVSGIEDIFDDTSKALFELLALRSEFYTLKDAAETICDNITSTGYGPKGSYNYCPLCGEAQGVHADWCVVTDMQRVLERFILD